MAAAASSIRSVSIVKIRWSINAYADPKPVLSEQVDPSVINQNAIRLKA
jgi:hypothetical protein